MHITSFEADVAISPDGQLVAYTTGGSRLGELQVRALNQLMPTTLVSEGRPSNPFFFPDGEWVEFFDDADYDDLTLKRVSVYGGPSLEICNLPEGASWGKGATWGPDDTIIFGTQFSGGLWQVAASGGEPEPLTSPDPERGQVNHGWPHILPGGREVLFTIRTGPALEQAQIAVLNLDSGDQTVLGSGGSNPRYSPTGHIVYGLDATLWAVGFDQDRLQLTSTPKPVLENVNTKVSGAANFGLSEDGSLVYVLGTVTDRLAQDRTFVWVDHEGRGESVTAVARAYQEFSLSPDGTQIAVRVGRRESPGGEDVWILNLARGTSAPLTSDPATASTFPTWTHNGLRVAFGGATLSWKAVDGTGGVESLTEDDGILRAPHAFSPDDTVLIFEEYLKDLGVLSLEGVRTATLLWESPWLERNPALSADGKWLAYESARAGDPSDVWVRPFPNVNDVEYRLSSGG